MENDDLQSSEYFHWRFVCVYHQNADFIPTWFVIFSDLNLKILLGTLRDDLIFFIYLYQKWIYPTDMKRTNEFGITGEQAEGNQPVEAPTAGEETNPADEPTGKEETAAVEPKPVEEKKND